MTQMQQVVLDGAGGIVVAEAAVPAPGAGEVLIKVGATGICGTDVHLLTGHYAAGRYPLVPGHEFAGHIAGVGAGVVGRARVNSSRLIPTSPAGPAGSAA